MRTGHNIFQQSIDEITSGIPELVGLGYKDCLVLEQQSVVYHMD